MTRDISAAFQTALEADEVKPFYAAQLDLDAGPLRLWTGYGDITIDGNTFTGAGSLLGFSGFEEVNDLSAKAISISLSGLDETVLSLALTTPIANRKVRVYFGVREDVVPTEYAVDGNEPQLLLDFENEVYASQSGLNDYAIHAIEIFTGLANTIPFTDDGQTAVVELSVDSKLVLLEKASNRRYTHESHQARHPGDTFFSYVADLQDKEVVWGRKSS